MGLEHIKNCCRNNIKNINYSNNKLKLLICLNHQQTTLENTNPDSWNLTTLNTYSQSLSDLVLQGQWIIINSNINYITFYNNIYSISSS